MKKILKLINQIINFILKLIKLSLMSEITKVTNLIYNDEYYYNKLSKKTKDFLRTFNQINNIVFDFTKYIHSDYEYDIILDELTFLKDISKFIYVEKIIIYDEKIKFLTKLFYIFKKTIKAVRLENISEYIIDLSSDNNIIIDNVNYSLMFLNITKLELINCNIKDITSLKYLTNLKMLNLNKNQINLDCLIRCPISSLINLETLNLSENQITDISSISNLTNLTKLFLNKNQIIDITPISNLYLEILDLDNNQITDFSIFGKSWKENHDNFTFPNICLYTMFRNPAIITNELIDEISDNCRGECYVYLCKVSYLYNKYTNHPLIKSLPLTEIISNNDLCIQLIDDLDDQLKEENLVNRDIDRCLLR